jgi:hypothetical protein
MRTAITEQQDVGDPVLPEKVVDEERPVAKAAPEARRLLRPVNAIAGADIDPLDLGTFAAQHAGELMKQWPRRSLQEEECAPLRIGIQPTRFAGFGKPLLSEQAGLVIEI